MPKAAWWVLISGLSTVAVAALQTLGANWIWTPVVIGVIGVLVKVTEVLLTERDERNTEMVARSMFAVEFTPEPKQSWFSKVLW
jgi:ABC-type enterochelin transport system permease subunit